MDSRGIPSVTVRIGSVHRTFDGAVPVTIGRDQGHLLPVHDPLVSRHHAELVWHGRWTIRDTGSANGTFVDGSPISDALAVFAPVDIRLGDPRSGPLLTIVPNTEPPDSTAYVLARPNVPITVPKSGLTLGRADDNDVVVSDVLVSRRHARVSAGPDGLSIEDLGSMNGTYVGGHRVTSTQLLDGQVFTIGNVDFLVVARAIVPRAAETTGDGLVVRAVGLVVGSNRTLLTGVDLDAAHGTLTALIGPSGAGKSTLSTVVSGVITPTTGSVMFDGHDVHAEYAALRGRIGMVPQDDVLHRQLTVTQALTYAAELRLPPDTTASDRAAVVAGVLAELSLTEHADTRIDALSGGQRKRASVALELLTGPSLLILDEPTSGLDPALDRQVMAMLRELADAGRVVIVVTHSVTYLDMCDQVLLLAPGGKLAYRGPAGGVGRALGTADWADAFAAVAADPDSVFDAYRARQPGRPQPPVAPRTRSAGADRAGSATTFRRQLDTVARRQLRLIAADRGYFVFLTVLPVLLGVLALVVPGRSGFGAAGQDAPTEPVQIMVLLIVGACFMGLSLSARDLVGERTIFRRERAAGLDPGAYLVAKTAVFGAVAVVQALVLVSLVLLGKGSPASASLLPGSFVHSGAIELMLVIAATTACSAILGLALSAMAKSAEQVMPMMVVTVMAQLVLCGGLIPVTGRIVLDQLSWLLPARWGFAAGASTVDVRSHVPSAQQDVLWQHEPAPWIFSMLVLSILGGLMFALVRHRLSRT
ncbi:ABC transporter [Rhodococcus sp. 06-235-1A]|uniref:FHA domain-containing protein n=1 Tax=Rhodococcus sp. 06-235-1A TaxID=2022508 RepID=UPI000B9BCE3A|nr:FHA domain-containing protein [Rhodococcus sp. 06-235-1A]OZD09290.1 ABC transporter [Rhodococcus sp. 06-235-1A]